MFYVGLDIHTKRISICALDEKGQLVHRSQGRNITDMMQSSKNQAHFYDLLNPLAARS
jgi:hypothetical protein